MSQTTDFEWFKSNYDELYKLYGLSYLAIKDQKVLGVHKRYSDAISAMNKTNPPGSCIVQLCNGNESGYTCYINSPFILFNKNEQT